ncbi:hypothetical protein YH66_09825 [[Brevibacterium] flavum]|uniref:Uncharacterized protein n=1 Tax=[Brevibacterium] flavum TaxID=92706 RepID=A0A0F6Z5S7_9CORY|nr:MULTISPECIES: hypothetical protein [Corynebacterium]AKF27825.1 hypothetical protein YH66_09825 [[Brevibacterium] flavum]ANE08659.1 hypothetical protein A3654_09885 [Corynebacterium glutamicum]AST21072.1 hypothetical protein CEY17_09965 [Corynebacterium glutamicum ATCC 14067]KEI23582.1 hypothetical protein KIQ_013750 [Corynebacterium glutamicum ATCC 14067]KIH73327.1 hypothetical protein SD36_09855 [Corynebacterium glutamicum]
MLSINSDEYPDVAYAQRYAAETNDTEVPIVTLWGKEWAITCVHNAEANCASIKAHIGDVDEYTSQPVNDDSSDLRRRLEALAPINQVTPDNLKEKCIMAIHDEIPDAGDFDFPTPVDLGAPDQATIYSDGGDFRYEVSEGEWNDAAYFCTVYTEDETITEATAIVVG